MIKDLIMNNTKEFESDFKIKSMDDPKQSRTNPVSKYLKVILTDGSLDIEGYRRDYDENSEKNLFKVGNVVKIKGELRLYQNKHQITIKRVEKSNKDPKDFDRHAPVDKETLVEEFHSFVSSIENESLKAIVNEVFKKYGDKFVDYPAAVRNHHEFINGLLFHTVTMCKVADSVCKIYTSVNRDLLISGCLLHDIGKVVELSGTEATKYTNEGNLLGHLVIGMTIVKEAADKLHIEGNASLLLEHMLLSHHGKLEYGSPVLPLTREALLLSMIDDMDAKMVMLEKAFETTKENDYSERVFGLDNRSFFNGSL